MRLSAILAFTLSLFAATSLPRAQTAPVRIPTSNGEVILADAFDQKAYDSYGFAGARRVGDLIYISGVIAGRRTGDGTDVAAFKAGVRRAFKHIGIELKAAGVSFDDVIMINTFHVWRSPNFSGTRDEQFEAFEAVKGEFMKTPHPAWTAVGTSGLLDDAGIVEIQMIAQRRVP